MPDANRMRPAGPRRVVVAGTGDDDAVLERHARRLRDAGTEVIWLGDGLEAAQIAAVAVAEDADAVALAGDRGGVEIALVRSGAGDIVVEPVP